MSSRSGVARAVKGATEDLASVTVRFSTGLTATFNTSRLGQQKIRTIEITQADSASSPISCVRTSRSTG